jgi:peptidyl-prolyl cis-trans isomerase B (cyclophilin B)
MKSFKFTWFLIAFFGIAINSCNYSETESVKKDTINKKTKVEMITTQGTIVLELYNQTPKHRDNFIMLADEGAFDSLLFHRVIEHFMIQGGDPDSKLAGPDDTLGNGDRDYRVDAEFRPDLFHKKGVIAGARDANPQRGSSAMQFYIVQGKVFNDSTLDKAEERINDYLARHFARAENPELSQLLEKAMDKGDWEEYGKYNDSLIRYGRDHQLFELYKIPQEHRDVYKTIGGTPHLDQSYTVFGEVVEGLEVVDKIASVETNEMDRPLNDVRIISVKVIK